MTEHWHSTALDTPGRTNNPKNSPNLFPVSTSVLAEGPFPETPTRGEIRRCGQDPSQRLIPRDRSSTFPHGWPPVAADRRGLDLLVDPTSDGPPAPGPLDPDMTFDDTPRAIA